MDVVRLLILGWVLGVSASLAAPPSVTEIRQDIQTRKSRNFEKLLQRWKKQYGTDAVQPLIYILADRKAPDADRYIAMMGIARLGGAVTNRVLTQYLRDRSWMIRIGSIRALMAINDPNKGKAILPLLRDKALVVRKEATEAVIKLKPEGAIKGLVGALLDKRNYHRGKAQWVPSLALDGLIELGAKEDVIAKLGDLLKYEKDKGFVSKTISTFERLSGKVLAKRKRLKDRIVAWKDELGVEDPLPVADESKSENITSLPY